MSNDSNQPGNTANSAGELLDRIGQLTRQLRDGMRELGLDKQVAKAAEAIPDARDRLNYVAAMTERAAHRALNAIDAAQPMQEGLATASKALSQRWAERSAGPAGLDQLITDTRDYLGRVPEIAGAINGQLMEIMMAQDFQDLTGQVIKKMMDVINEVETQLLQVLIDNSSLENRYELNVSLQQGPQVKPGNASAVTSQAQVDDLLESLRF